MEEIEFKYLEIGECFEVTLWPYGNLNLRKLNNHQGIDRNNGSIYEIPSGNTMVLVDTGGHRP